MLWKKKSFFSDFICNIHETQTLLDIRNLNKNIIYTSVNKKKNTWKLFLILSLSSTGQGICDIVT